MWSVSDAHYSGHLSAGTSVVSALFVDEARQRLVAASGDDSVLSLALNPSKWVSLACAKANWTLTAEEWHELLPDDSYVGSCTDKGR